MEVIRPGWSLMTLPQLVRNSKYLIEEAGRTCYKSEELINEQSADRFIKNIIARGHESVLEHANITVRVTCDRGVSHELVRHRIASYSQESTRYCNYKDKEIQFIQPCWFRCDYTILDPKEFSSVISDDAFPREDRLWLRSMQASEWQYKALLDLGWKPEQARSVLPNSLKTEIVVTMNLREWRHFFKLRTAAAAHPQMREIAGMILHGFSDLLPEVFLDLMEGGEQDGKDEN